jgi:uncharacterized small protein (DUF1192 family)
MSWHDFIEWLFPGVRRTLLDDEAQDLERQSDAELSERLAQLHDEQARLLRMAAKRRNNPRLKRLAEQVAIEAQIERHHGLEKEAYDVMVEDIEDEG